MIPSGSHTTFLRGSESHVTLWHEHHKDFPHGFTLGFPCLAAFVRCYVWTSRHLKIASSHQYLRLKLPPTGGEGQHRELPQSAFDAFQVGNALALAAELLALAACRLVSEGDLHCLECTGETSCMHGERRLAACGKALGFPMAAGV